MNYTIDAQGKKIGRIASQAAGIILGKNSTNFTKNNKEVNHITIVNASLSDVSAKKKSGEVYRTYTGFRGGLNEETLGNLIKRKGLGEVYRRAIYKMLPNNKLRANRMKALTIKE